MCHRGAELRNQRAETAHRAELPCVVGDTAGWWLAFERGVSAVVTITMVLVAFTAPAQAVKELATLPAHRGRLFRSY